MQLSRKAQVEQFVGSFFFQKIVIEHPEEYPTVVRTCGKPCNETKSGFTTTSCCESELCNGAADVQNNFSLKITLGCLSAYVLITRQFTARREEIL